MAELIKIANDMPIKYNLFTITYRIQTGNRKFCRWYNDNIKYPIGSSRSEYENQSIANTEKYCESTGEKIITWAILDKNDKKANFQNFNPITSKIYSRQ